MSKKRFSFSAQKDGFSLILVLIAIFCAYLAAHLLVDPNKDLNSAIALIYITIATLISSILEPILKLLKFNKNKSKLVSLSLSLVVIIAIVVYDFISGKTDVFDTIVSFSKRGGFTAISVTLLLFQLAFMNYEAQIETEEELYNANKKNREHERQEKAEKLALKKENMELKKKLLKKEKRG